MRIIRCIRCKFYLVSNRFDFIFCLPALPLQTASQPIQNGDKCSGKDPLTSDDSAFTDLSPKTDSSPETETPTKTDASSKTDVRPSTPGNSSSPQPKKGAARDEFIACYPSALGLDVVVWRNKAAPQSDIRGQSVLEIWFESQSNHLWMCPWSDLQNISLDQIKSNQISFTYKAQIHSHVLSVGFTIWHPRVLRASISSIFVAAQTSKNQSSGYNLNLPQTGFGLAVESQSVTGSTLLRFWDLAAAACSCLAARASDHSDAGW